MHFYWHVHNFNKYNVFVCINAKIPLKRIILIEPCESSPEGLWKSLTRTSSRIEQHVVKPLSLLSPQGLGNIL